MLCDTCKNPIHCANLGRCDNFGLSSKALNQMRSGRITGAESALSKQVSGNHYKDKAIQPIIYIHANNLGFCEGNVVKYITRWKDKNGIADLEKAKHYIELLIEMENAGK